jgi:hypothetical protein
MCKLAIQLISPSKTSFCNLVEIFMRKITQISKIKKVSKVELTIAPIH